MLNRPLVQLAQGTLLLGSILAVSPSASADIQIDFSGFGTLGAAILDSDTAEYRSNLAQDGADNKGTFELDTRLGLQTDIVLSHRASATLQLLAQEGHEGDPRLEIEWALGQFFLSDSWSFRIGRMAMPAFTLSDYRYVTYAITPIRPPEDVYSLIPFGSYTGADLIGNFEFGDTLLDVQLYTGSATENGYDGFTVDVDDSLGVNVSIEHGFVKFRTGYITSKIDGTSPDLELLIQGLTLAQPFAPQVDPLLSSLTSTNNRSSLFSLGLNLEFDKYFFDAEFVSRNADNWVPDANAFSMLLGYRHGTLTPYLFASASREREGNRSLTLPDGALFQQLEEGVNLFLAPRDQTTVGLGLRWSIAENIALKAQIERISRENLGTSFIRTSTDDGLDDGEDVTLLGLTVDFVF